MTLTGKIFRDKEEEQIYLDLLTNHFGSVETFEKYPDASMNLLFTRAFEKVLGKNFMKERISKRKEIKLKEEIVKQIRNKYGPWISISHFKIKDVYNIRFATNLNRAYRVEGYGILYGGPLRSISGNVFFTSHCLERFEERSPQILYDAFIFRHRAKEIKPSPVDFLIYLISNCDLEFGRLNEYCYLNLHIGILVMEDLGDVFITKTFLKPLMLHKHVKWYQSEIDKETIYSFADIMKGVCYPIESPNFLELD